MNLQMRQEFDSLTETAGAPPRPRAVAAKSLVKVIVINVISIILLIGNSG